jgi:hypothetical protein
MDIRRGFNRTFWEWLRDNLAAYEEGKATRKAKRDRKRNTRVVNRNDPPRPRNYYSDF